MSSSRNRTVSSSIMTKQSGSGAKRVMFAKSDAPTGSARSFLSGRTVPKLLPSMMLKIGCYVACGVREDGSMSLSTIGITTAIGTTTAGATVAQEGLSNFMSTCRRF